MPETPSYWPKAVDTLTKADPVMATLCRQFKGEAMQSRGDALHTLLRSIVGQQISVKAAESVWNQFVTTIPEFSPPLIMACEDDTLRACGLSRQKVLYIKEISSFFHSNTITKDYFRSKSDDEVIAELTSIKGIGRWTAEMFLMFHLLRPDVLPLDDIGLQRGIERLYNAGERMSRGAYLDIAAKWKPYRSVATWFLWRSLDPVPVEY